MASATATPETRTQGAVHAVHLVDRHERLRQDIRQLEQDKEQYDRELEEYRAQVTFVP